MASRWTRNRLVALAAAAVVVIALLAAAAYRARRLGRRRRLQRPFAVRRRAGVQGLRGADRARGRAPRRHRARAVRAAPPRGCRDARRPARHDGPREPLAREGGRRARARRHARPAVAGRRTACTTPTALVGAEHPPSRADALDRARAADAVTSYEDLGDPRFRGRLCLRTSNNEYNQSFVADRIAKHGEAETEELLRSWMANEPHVLGSDVDVLDAIAAGRCDVGLTNHYYLGRELKDNPRFAGRARLARPGRRRRAHEPLGRRPRQGRRAPRGRGATDGVPDRPRGPGGHRLQQRVRGQPRRPAAGAHPRLGDVKTDPIDVREGRARRSRPRSR